MQTPRYSGLNSRRDLDEDCFLCIFLLEARCFRWDCWLLIQSITAILIFPFYLRIPWEFSLSLSCLGCLISYIHVLLCLGLYAHFKGALLQELLVKGCVRLIFLRSDMLEMSSSYPLLDYSLTYYRILDWRYFPSEYWKHCSNLHGSVCCWEVWGHSDFWFLACNQSPRSI